MKRRRGAGERTKPPDHKGDEVLPALPAWKAFVVQFSRETGTEAGTFTGRVEHLSSGHRARFGSAEELVTILGKLLDQLCKDSNMDGSQC